jgi:hypothetical protein
MSTFITGPKTFTLDSLSDVKGFDNASAGAVYGFKKTSAGLPYEPSLIASGGGGGLYNFSFTRAGPISDSASPFSIGDAEKNSRSSFVIPVDSELVYATLISYTGSNVGTPNAGTVVLILDETILNIFVSKIPGEISSAITFNPKISFQAGSRIGLYTVDESINSVFTSVSLYFSPEASASFPTVSYTTFIPAPMPVAPMPVAPMPAVSPELTGDALVAQLAAEDAATEINSVIVDYPAPANTIPTNPNYNIIPTYTPTYTPTGYGNIDNILSSKNNYI